MCSLEPFENLARIFWVEFLNRTKIYGVFNLKLNQLQFPVAAPEFSRRVAQTETDIFRRGANTLTQYYQPLPQTT